MSLSTIVQSQVHAVRIIRRHVSSKASNVQSRRFLPAEKMRALISLYHQSDTFITPENLSQRIDDAFVPQTTQSRLPRQHVTLKDLNNALTSQRAAPKVSEWDLEAVASVDYDNQDVVNWSSFKTARESKVIEALYGVDIAHSRRALPGLEVLEESGDSIQQSMTEDAEEEARRSLKRH